MPGKGSIAHARLIYIDKPHILRMEGALGPLQAFPVTGVTTFELTPDGDKAAKLKLSYMVGGYMPGGMEKMAGPVDGVLGEQLDSLKAAAEAPLPPAQ